MTCLTINKAFKVIKVRERSKIKKSLPPFTFPQGEAGALKNSLAGYFSEQAGLPRWPSLQSGSFAKPAHRAGSIRSALPLGEGWEGGEKSYLNGYL